MILWWNLVTTSTTLSLLVSVVEGLVLPSPLSSTHSILLHPDARHGHRRHSVCTPPASFVVRTKQRSGHVCLTGPLNVMSLDNVGGDGSSSITGQHGHLPPPDPINITTLVDPSSLDVIDWVDAAASQAAADIMLHHNPPKELPVIVEEDMIIIESPEDILLRAPRRKIYRCCLRRQR